MTFGCVYSAFHGVPIVTPYSSICDDFGIYLYLNTEIPLSSQRETVLHYFETIKRHYPGMTHFHCRENNEFVLEEDKESGSYRWAALESKRLCSGYVNPPSFEEVDAQHLSVMQIAPYHFDVTSLDCEALDVVFAFDLVYNGNHDEIVAEILGSNSPLEGLINWPSAKMLKYEPLLMLSLDTELGMQCRLSIETRTTPFQVRTGQFSEEPISIYFTVRQYWNGQPLELLEESYKRQRAQGQEMVDQQLIPSVIQPLAQAISNK